MTVCYLRKLGKKDTSMVTNWNVDSHDSLVHRGSTRIYIPDFINWYCHRMLH